MYQIDAKVISKKQISKNYFLITFLAEKISRKSFPGQFVMIKIDNSKTFLRRPFSICGVNKKTFDIVFKVVGIGTEILSQKQEGDTLNIIGPLGNPYPSPQSLNPRLKSGAAISQSLVFVAGGTGVASLLFLAQQLVILSEAKNLNLPLTVFIGAKTKKDVIFETEFKKLGCKVIISTEDGSYGKKGLVSDVFHSHLPSPISHLPSVVYACGPKEMLKEIVRISKKHRMKCFVSLEEKMACGVGGCMGCAIKVRSPKSHAFSGGNSVRSQKFEYKRVCKDGPVFDADEIVW